MMKSRQSPLANSDIAELLSSEGALSLARAPSRLGRSQSRNDLFWIINATAPGSAAGPFEGGPQSRVIRQSRVNRKIRSCWPLGKHSRAFIWCESASLVSNKVDCPFYRPSVDRYPDNVSVLHFSNGTSRQSFRANVADACA